MHHQSRRHSVATFIVLMIFSPYIAAFALVFILAYMLAAILDAIGGRN